MVAGFKIEWNLQPACANSEAQANVQSQRPVAHPLHEGTQRWRNIVQMDDDGEGGGTYDPRLFC